MKRHFKKEFKRKRDSFTYWQESQTVALDHSLGSEPTDIHFKHHYERHSVAKSHSLGCEPQVIYPSHKSPVGATPGSGIEYYNFIMPPPMGFGYRFTSLPRVSPRLHPGLRSGIPAGLHSEPFTYKHDITICDLKLEVAFCDLKLLSYSASA